MMTKIIVANFKMNGSYTFIRDYFHHLTSTCSHKVIICPPFPYFTLVGEYMAVHRNTDTFPHLYLGGQNCHEAPSGAFTGEVSASMLQDLNCRYIILGHSERRTHYEETSTLVHQKAEQALQANLIPIICVGESWVEREQGRAQDIIRKQLEESIPPTTKQLMVAYEPVWAIGSGRTATQEDIESMHAFIHSCLKGKSYPILYGGSVNATNSQEILSYNHVDGVLVGGASLKINDFNIILETSNKEQN